MSCRRLRPDRDHPPRSDTTGTCGQQANQRARQPGRTGSLQAQFGDCTRGPGGRLEQLAEAPPCSAREFAQHWGQDGGDGWAAVFGHEDQSTECTSI